MKKPALLLAVILTSTTLFAHTHTADSSQQYLLIIRFKANAPKLSDDALKNNQQHWSAWIGHLAQTGKLVIGYRPSTDGKTISGIAKTAKDGPYGNDQEVVSSIFIIKAASPDEADSITRTCPIYETDGSIEIRPITDTAH
jgi:hypothetical protein